MNEVGKKNIEDIVVVLICIIMVGSLTVKIGGILER